MTSYDEKTSKDEEMDFMLQKSHISSYSEARVADGWRLGLRALWRFSGREAASFQTLPAAMFAYQGVACI
jgi:hypothetical protein